MNLRQLGEKLDTLRNSSLPETTETNLDSIVLASSKDGEPIIFIKVK